MPKIVEEQVIKNPSTRFIMGWSGSKGRGIVVYRFDDGTLFQPYVASPIEADYTYISRGCSDVSGEAFEPYMEEVLKTWSKRGQERAAGKIYINSRELSKPESESEALARIRAYSGGLRYDPEDWPEPFKTAWFESH